MQSYIFLLFHHAGSGSQSVPVPISNAADGSAGLFTTWHIAPQFTYTLGVSNGLAASSNYVAVLHFAGVPCAYLLAHCLPQHCVRVSARKGHSQAFVTPCLAAACPVIVSRYRSRYGWCSQSKTGQVHRPRALMAAPACRPQLLERSAQAWRSHAWCSM